MSIEPYHDTYHHYVDAIFTAKLGIGYITGVLELLLGALIYVMCLPFVRKSGHFQVKKKQEVNLILSKKNLYFSYFIGVIC